MFESCRARHFLFKFNAFVDLPDFRFSAGDAKRRQALPMALSSAIRQGLFDGMDAVPTRLAMA